jgi:hypothetical protein
MANLNYLKRFSLYESLLFVLGAKKDRQAFLLFTPENSGTRFQTSISSTGYCSYHASGSEMKTDEQLSTGVRLKNWRIVVLN